MRMWMVDPKILCRQHLLGEHNELHMRVGALEKGQSIEGYVTNGLVDTSKITPRHNELVAEMEARNYMHHSPLDFTHSDPVGEVSIQNNLDELERRCVRCKQRIGNLIKGW